MNPVRPRADTPTIFRAISIPTRPWIPSLLWLLFEMGFVLLFLLQLGRGTQYVDFLAFHTAARHIVSGNPDSLYDLSVVIEYQQPVIEAQDEALLLRFSDGSLPFLYLPIYATLFVPIGILPLALGRLVWGCLSYCAARLAVRLTRRWFQRPRRRTLLLLAFPPLWIALANGQMSPVSLLLFTGVAIHMWQNSVGFLTGVLAGLALFKPQLLVPLLTLWVAQRRWRAIAGFITTGLALLGSSWLLSASALRAYVTEVPPLVRQMQVELVGKGLVISPAVVLGRPNNVTTVLLLVVLGALLVLLIAWRRPITPYHHALLWLAPLVTTPYLIGYDLLLMLLPISFLAPSVRCDRAVAVALTLVGLSFLSWALSGTLHLTGLTVLLLFALSAYRAIAARPLPEGKSVRA